MEDTRPGMEELNGKQGLTPVEKWVKLLSIGFFVDPENAPFGVAAWRGNALKQLIVDARWGELDYL